MSQLGGAAPSRQSRVHANAPEMDSATPLYTVSQVARLLNVQAAFVRRLDTEGVVVPARTAGGQRRYSSDDVDHITALLALISDGSTVAGAQRIIELENEIADLRGELDAR
ncbi:MAG TPA: MerR family transcriptional regulator [Ilumatobacteraceae bacterium]|jgi:excisionase family DNA binding protein|nr:MerR family transcriptional regulator [Ilumatobacteraceae bacterium]